MASQKMRLEAEMKDNASPAIRKLRQELAELQATGAETRGTTKLNQEIAQLRTGAAVDGSAAVRKLRGELADLQKATAENRAITGLNKEIAGLKKQSGEVSPTAGMKSFVGWMGEAKTAATGVLGAVGGFAEVLGPIGIGAVGAGAAVSSLASEMKRLGEQSLAMKELSRETGISLDFVNRWSHAGEHFAVSGDAMRGMLDRFGGQLPDFNRGIGGMFKEFSQWPDLVRKMQHEGPADALLDAFRQAEEVGRAKGPAVQKQFLDAIGLGPDAAKLMGDHGLIGLMDQLNKSYASPSPGIMKEAQALRDATIGLNNDFEKLENEVAPGFLKVLSTGIKGIDLLVKGWVWEFQTIADIWERLSKAAKPGAEAFDKNEKRTLPDPPASAPPPVFESPEDIRRRQNGQNFGLMGKKASYDGAGFGNLRQNASFTTGADPSSSSQFGLRGIMTDATKAGVVAAFREMMIDQSLKDAAGVGNEGGGGGGAGASGSGGRRGFSLGEGGGTGSAGAGHKAANNAELMKAAQEQLLKEGVSADHVKAAAAALVGNVVQESGGDPNKVHDGGTGYGLYGARLGRRDKMLSWLSENGFAKNSAEGQMKYMAHEAMTTKEYANTAAALRMAQQSNLGSITDAVARNFERPNEAAANYGGRRNNAAAAFGSDIGGRSGATSDVGMHLRALNEQCVSLAKAAVGANGSVHEWRRGVGALAGTLKPGTPVATFLDGFGRKVDRYANGGTGTPGAHLDHAGVFQSYIRDKAGQIVGMNIAEQYKGSHGVHSKAYYNKGWGESNAANYSAVLGPDGQPLGGSRNPMNRRATELAAAPHPAAGRRATGLPDSTREQQAGSEHLVRIDLRDPGGHVKATRVERKGPLRIEMENKWQTQRNPLIAT